MVELADMAELMHDDVVGKVRRQERNAVVEIEIPPLRAASPSRLLAADADAAVSKIIKLVEMGEAFRRDLPRLFLVCKISLAVAPRDQRLGTYGAEAEEAEHIYPLISSRRLSACSMRALMESDISPISL